MLIQSRTLDKLLVEEKLIYRGEGNSSLVVALYNARSVLRLVKDKQLAANHSRGANELFSVLQKHIVFNETTIRAILPPELFAVPKLVKVSSDQILRIHQLVRDKRPSFRLDKSISSSGDTFALLLPDYCCIARPLDVLGPVIGVEIKPKQGFLPEEEVLSGCLAIKARVCRYGLSQFHKLNKGSISRRSGYCPLDLFSGCATRQMTALRSLIADPQNNFRVFRDVKYAFGDQTNSALDDVIRDFVFCDDTADAFCRLLLSALSLKVSSNKSLKFSRETKQQFCGLHNNASHRCSCHVTEDHRLSVGSVLESILCAQRLDSIDSFLANEMLEKIKELNNNNNEDFLNSGIPKNWFLREKSDDETQNAFCHRKVCQFLVSLTAKDCSIMIAMQRTHDSNVDRNVITMDNTRYVCEVRVTDLDEKPAHKITRTLRNDKRMISASKLI